MPHYGYINPIDIGAEPDDTPTGRCHGPAYPDSPGCGRFARGGMCGRCAEVSRDYWKRDTAEHRAWEDAQIAKEAELEAAYQAAEMAAHPPMVARCAWCEHVQPCRWNMPGYICVDREMCERRLLDTHERNLGFQSEREWSREDLIF